MKKVYASITVFGTLVFAVYYNLQLAPNPWMVEDRTFGRSNVCEVHKALMAKKKVNVVYGYGASSSWIKKNARSQEKRDAFVRDEERGFPNARDDAYGDCLVSNKAPAAACVYVCDDCTSALQKWVQQKTAN